MTSWTYEATKKGYAKMWDSIAIKGGADAKNASHFATLIEQGEDQYRVVSEATGVPWGFIGALHMRESSCNFKGVLHNGEKIIGTKRKTKLVPAGRGPFNTWAEAAIDALQMKAHLWAGKVWCPALMGFVAENFNGLGNVARGVNSAYLWAGSNHEQLGKYVADHKFDPKFDDPQIGVMTVLKALAQVNPDVAAELKVNHVSPMSTAKKVIIGTAGGGTLAGTVAGTVDDTKGMLDTFQPVIDVIQNHGTTIGLIFTVAIIVGAVGWHFYEKYQAGPNAEAGV